MSCLDFLIKGNDDFVKNAFGETGYIETQRPHTAILCCSDSRVPVERIFSMGKGEIFVVRNAGNTENASVIASLEYAVTVLLVKNLIVLGHSECGAVKAAMSNQKLDSPYLDELAEKIRSNLIGYIPDDPILKNSEATLKDLIYKSEIIKNAMLSRKLTMNYGVYDIRTGRVELHALSYGCC